MKKLTIFALALCLAFSVMGTGLAEQQPDRVVASSTYGWVVEPATQDDNHIVSVGIVEAGTFEKKTVTSSYPLDDYNSITDTFRSDSLVTLLAIPDTFVEVLYNAAGEVIDLEVIEKTNGNARSNYKYYFDSAKYGGELTAPGGGPGRMVAQGWVLEKDADAKTITIGDGNHVVYSFEQTYTLADDAKIYLVDNGSQVSGTSLPGTYEGTEATFDDIIVTEKEGEDGKCPGEIYYVPERYTALMIFDGDYTTYEDGALVTEVYMYKNPFVLNEEGINRSTDVARPDGMQYNGTSWLQAVSKVQEKHDCGWNGAVEPIEMLKDRLYMIGDSYTACYLFVADNGDTAVLDMGNEVATYQYWLNIEKCGYDPREVDKIMLTHGHGDHYQALYEFVTMLNRYHVGLGDLDMWDEYPAVETAYQNATGYGYLGYPEIGPQLTDKSIRYVLTDWTKWYHWYDLGGGVDVYPVGSTGHTADSPSFAWIVTAREGDAYFAPGTKVGFVYNGAYGANSSLSAGYRRTAMNYGLMYVQQVLAPYIDTLCDCIYYAPQHMNHYPISEIYEVSKKLGVPMFSIYTEGVANIQNVMEKRIAVNYYEQFQESWANGTNEMSNYIIEKIGIPAQTSNPNFQSQQKYGPYKRPEGTYEMEVLDIQIIQGTNAWQNVNDAWVEATKGMTNVYGVDLSQGLLTGIDAHVHNPDKYVVQVSCHVHDDYKGQLDYETNFYGTENYASAWTSGPIETANIDMDHIDEWFEILRTEYVDYDTAVAIADTLKAGGVYNVYMHIDSEIIVPENPAETFIEVK